MLLRSVDFETTGEPPDAAVCEVGWVDVVVDEQHLAKVSAPKSSLINPGRPMPPDARGVHHLSDADLKDAPPYSPTVMKALTDWGVPIAFIAHKADFEKSFFELVVGDASVPYICTYKVALRVWPDSPNHKNQTLRYYLGLDDKYPGFSDHAMPPHRAAADAWTTAHIFVEALSHAAVEQMIAWSAEPVLMPKINFGTKHKGQPWSAADDDYLDWIISKSELSDDTKWNAKREKDRRAAEAREAYVVSAIADAAKQETVDKLTYWFHGEVTKRATHAIAKGSPEYDRIVAACAARKAELLPPAPQTAPAGSEGLA